MASNYNEICAKDNMCFDENYTCTDCCHGSGLGKNGFSCWNGDQYTKETCCTSYCAKDSMCFNENYTCTECCHGNGRGKDGSSCWSGEYTQARCCENQNEITVPGPLPDVVILPADTELEANSAQCIKDSSCFDENYTCTECCHGSGRGKDGSSCWGGEYTQARCCENQSNGIPQLVEVTDITPQLPKQISPVAPAAVTDVTPQPQLLKQISPVAPVTDNKEPCDPGPDNLFESCVGIEGATTKEGVPCFQPEPSLYSASVCCKKPHSDESCWLKHDAGNGKYATFVKKECCDEVQNKDKREEELRILNKDEREPCHDLDKCVGIEDAKTANGNRCFIPNTDYTSNICCKQPWDGERRFKGQDKEIVYSGSCWGKFDTYPDGVDAPPTKEEFLKSDCCRSMTEQEMSMVSPQSSSCKDKHPFFCKNKHDTTYVCNKKTDSCEKSNFEEGDLCNIYYHPYECRWPLYCKFSGDITEEFKTGTCEKFVPPPNEDGCLVNKDLCSKEYGPSYFCNHKTNECEKSNFKEGDLCNWYSQYEKHNPYKCKTPSCMHDGVASPGAGKIGRCSNASQGGEWLKNYEIMNQKDTFTCGVAFRPRMERDGSFKLKLDGSFETVARPCDNGNFEKDIPNFASKLGWYFIRKNGLYLGNGKTNYNKWWEVHAIEPEYRTYDQIKNSNFPYRHIALRDIEEENLAYEHWKTFKMGPPWSNYDDAWYMQMPVLGKENRNDLPVDADLSSLDINKHEKWLLDGKSIVTEIMKENLSNP